MVPLSYRKYSGLTWAIANVFKKIGRLPIEVPSLKRTNSYLLMATQI